MNCPQNVEFSQFMRRTGRFH